MVSYRNRVTLAMREATYRALPTFSAGPILFRDLEFAPVETDTVTRTTIRPWMGNDIRKNRTNRGRLVGGVDLAASGAAGTAPAWRYMMRACGMAETITTGVKVEYTPVSASFESVACQFWMDGFSHGFVGGRGTWSIELKEGELPALKFDIMGFPYTVVLGTMSASMAFTDWPTPLPFSFETVGACTLFGVVVNVIDFSYTHGNSISYRDTMGHLEIRISDRAPSASITIEVPADLTVNFTEVARLGTTAGLTIQYGYLAGARIDIVIPKLRILPDVKYGQTDGLATMTLHLLPLPTSGDDEITLRVL